MQAIDPITTEVQRLAALSPEESEAQLQPLSDTLKLQVICELIKQNRDYLQDLRILVRILTDIAKIFGVVDENDRLKKMSQEQYGAAVLEGLTRLLTKAMQCKMPIVGKRHEQELIEQFFFLEAIMPMEGKYDPATLEDLKAMIAKANNSLKK